MQPVFSKLSAGSNYGTDARAKGLDDFGILSLFAKTAVSQQKDASLGHYTSQ
jgi:hypothetical protein